MDIHTSPTHLVRERHRRVRVHMMCQTESVVECFQAVPAFVNLHMLGDKLKN